MREKKKAVLYTIGHSTHTLEEFVDLLKAHGIEQVVDVRTIPRSRRYPHFNSTFLGPALREAGIGYLHLPELGGLRHTHADSPNRGWRNASFRGYADYMGTSEFAEGLAKLENIAQEKRTAVMCAEAVPWRCHRSLIADAFIVDGGDVFDILGKGAAHEHALTPFLCVKDGKIMYPPQESTERKKARCISKI